MTKEDAFQDPEPFQITSLQEASNLAYPVNAHDRYM